MHQGALRLRWSSQPPSGPARPSSPGIGGVGGNPLRAVRGDLDDLGCWFSGRSESSRNCKVVSVWIDELRRECGFACSRTLNPMGHLHDHSGHPKRVSHDSGTMRATIRSATLSGYPELARSVGLDPHRLMGKCGLDPSCLSDPDARIDATAVAKLLETSAAESGVEDFGLRLSKARRLSNLGPFSLVVREETTARRALETLGRYLQLHSELLSIRIEDAGNLVILRVDIVPGGGCLAGRGSNSSRVICSASCKSCWARHGSRGAFCSCTRRLRACPAMSPCSGASSTSTLNSTASPARRRTWPGRFHPQIRSWRDMHASIWMQ